MVRRVVAAAVLVLAVVAVVMLLTGGGPNYKVELRVRNASQLVKGNLVQAGGRKVGVVESIELAPDGAAEVEIGVDALTGPLRRGTRATIRTASLSGVANRYVDLEMPPGEAQEVIPDGGVIPVDDTTSVVDLDHLDSLRLRLHAANHQPLPFPGHDRLRRVVVVVVLAVVAVRAAKDAGQEFEDAVDGVLMCLVALARGEGLLP